MTTAKDFMAAFNDRPVRADAPHLDMDGCKFILRGIRPYREWVMTGELKADGSPKWAQADEPVLDETGTRCRVEVDLQLLFPDGQRTSSSSPFTDNKHYMSLDKIKALVGAVGEEVEVEGARIEFKEVAETVKSFNRVVTRMQFVFDDIKA